MSDINDIKTKTTQYLDYIVENTHHYYNSIIIVMYYTAEDLHWTKISSNSAALVVLQKYFTG